MSVLRVIKKETLSKSPRARKYKRWILYKCDQCEVEYTGKYQKKYTNNRATFCSRTCFSKSKKKGGTHYNTENIKKARKAFKEKYNTSNPSDLDWVNNKKRETINKTMSNDKLKKIIVDKRKNTCLSIYGVDNPMKSECVKSRAKNTNLERYGVENVFESELIKKRIEETNMIRFGVKHNSNNPDTVNKRKKTSLERFGVECRLSSADVRKKAQDTMIKKYGVQYGFQSKIIDEKISDTMLEKYGVRYGFQSKEILDKCHSPEAKLKRHKTMKANGTYGKSKSEDEFFELLCKRFGEDNVERQVNINGWSIDFKVNDTYIQFDGVYWHGLDRDIEVIKEFKNPRDKVIYKTFLRDQEQNNWFAQQKIKLVRITDHEFKRNKKCLDCL